MPRSNETKSKRSKSLSLHHKQRYDERKSKYALTSNYSKYLISKNFEFETEGLKLIAAFVLTDGWISWNQKKRLFELGFTNTNEELLQAFNDIAFLSFDEVPSCITLHKKQKQTRYVAPWHQKMVKQVRNNCIKNGKKSAKNILENDNISTQKECLRIALSCDGYISFEISIEKYGFGKKYYSRLRPVLALGCKPKKLRVEWAKIFKKIGIKTQMKKDRLKTNSWNNLTKFQNMGGFLDCVLIGKDSCFFEGVEKNAMIEKLISIKNRKLQNRQSNTKNPSYLKKIILSNDR